MIYAIIKTDGTHTVVEGQPKMADIHKALATPDDAQPFFEIVGSQKACIYLNEEGKFKNLPANEVATRFARAEKMISERDFIAGDVLVAGPPDEEGFHTTLPEGVLEEILRES